MNLLAIARRFNAARAKRQAMRKQPSCIDTESSPGSWQAVLDSGAHSIRVVSDSPAIPLRPDPDYRRRRLAQFSPERQAKYFEHIAKAGL